MASAQAQTARYQVYARATESDQTNQADFTYNIQLFCPKWGAETGGGKFCQECGVTLVEKGTCPSCKQAIQPGAKFCPDCGNRIGFNFV